MAFPPDFLDEIRNRVGLADLIGRRVKLQKRGREHQGLCPFHNEKTPSFTVSEEKGFFHCFGCGAHGDVIGFVMRSEGLSFPEAVEKLAGVAGLPVPQSSPAERQAEQRRSDLTSVLEEAAAWFEAQLSALGGKAAREYLEERGLGSSTVGQFRLGFAPGRRGALKQAMNAKGIGDDLLVEAGLLKRPDEAAAAGQVKGSELRDYFFNRVMFPISDPRGRVIAFGGRTLGESRAKYINSPDTPLFHKGRVLFNLARARQAAHATGELIVAEGYMDVIALDQAGFHAAVAPLGTAITEAQIALLWRLAQEPILCLDGDKAGRRAAYRAAERVLPLLRPGYSLRFAMLPPGDDPDSLLSKDGVQAMRALLEQARPLAEVVWHLASEDLALDTPERRAGLRQTLRRSIEQISDSDVREAYRQDMDRRLDAAFGRGGAPGQAKFGSAGSRSWRGKKIGRDPASLGRYGPDRRPGLLPDVSVPPVVRRPPDVLRRRRGEEVLLAALVNHPELLSEHAEEVASLVLSNPDLTGLRRALIDLASAQPGLDTAALRRHLCDQGLGGVLEGLLHSRVYVHGSFARPGAPLEEARHKWVEMLSGHRRQQNEGEAKEATRELAQDMSEESLAKLQAKQRLNQAGQGGDVDLESFETADRK